MLLRRILFAEFVQNTFLKNLHENVCIKTALDSRLESELVGLVRYASYKHKGQGNLLRGIENKTVCRWGISLLSNKHLKTKNGSKLQTINGKEETVFCLKSTVMGKVSKEFNTVFRFCSKINATYQGLLRATSILTL